jgi:hypothetical protein
VLLDLGLGENLGDLDDRLGRLDHPKRKMDVNAVQRCSGSDDGDRKGQIAAYETL